MEIRFIIAAICLGIGCYIAGFLTDAFLQADYIRQKDDQIRQLKGEKKPFRTSSTRDLTSLMTATDIQSLTSRL